MYTEPYFILIELDDEITDVLGKIRDATETCVYIVFPSRSLLLASVVNLKLLRKKAEQLGKKLAIVTADKIGRNLASQAGLSVFKDKREVALAMQYTSPEEVISVSQSVDDTVLTRGNDFYLRWKKRFTKTLTEDSQNERYKLMFIKPSKRAFITILIGSIGVLAAILFFALPDAKIHISSKLNPVQSETNITLTTDPTDLLNRLVHMEPIEVTFDRVLREPPTGQTVIGGKATGTVKIYNNTSNPWPIVGNSRVQTKDGLIFLTKAFVTVPPAKNGKAGETSMQVEARDLDLKGGIIGSRGNIEPTKFIFPGLSATNQKLITAESFTPFTGGTTSVQFFVTKEDITRANKNILQELKNHAPEELTNLLKAKMAATKTADLQILQIFDDRFVKLELQEVKLPKDILGKNIEAIEVTGRMEAKAYYFNVTDVIAILTEHMKTHELTYREKLLKVDKDSMQFINIFPFKGNSVKITTKLRGLVTYSFDKNSDELMKKIRDQITGVTAENAKRYIQNLPEVEDVSTTLSPFWQKSLPTIKENLHIIVEEPKV